MTESTATGCGVGDFEHHHVDESCYYQDGSGILQGPFTVSQMKMWYQSAQFPDDLLIRSASGGEFVRIDSVPDITGLHFVGGGAAVGGGGAAVAAQQRRRRNSRFDLDEHADQGMVDRFFGA